MLKYFLLDNPLTERPDDYAAQTVATRAYSRNEIIDLLLRKGTLVTRTDAVAVLNIVEEVVVDIIRDGGTVNLPLFNTSFSISGVFDGPMDTFDPSRHKLNVNLTKGTLLRNAEREVRVQKTDVGTTMPAIIEVKDAISGTTNETLTPNGVIQLWGSNVKVDGDHADVGLWFVPETGDAVKATVLVSNKPSSVIAMIPALAAGAYTLRLVTQHSGSNLLKTPRTIVYDRTLTVA